jgi:hypothetical protein
MHSPAARAITEFAGPQRQSLHDLAAVGRRP